MNPRVSEAFENALAVLTALGGGGVLVLLLSGWLGKVWANRLMQGDIAKHAKDLEEKVAKHAKDLEEIKSKFEVVNRRLQAELDKTLHVYRVQFETEFKALIEIWTKVSAMRSAIVAATPTFRTEATDEEKLQELIPVVQRVKKALHDLKDAVDDHSPFYPKPIYDRLDELIMTIVQEQQQLEQDYLRGDPNAILVWFEINQAFVDKFAALADQISELMREEIKSLSVYRE